MRERERETENRGKEREIEREIMKGHESEQYIIYGRREREKWRVRDRRKLMWFSPTHALLYNGLNGCPYHCVTYDPYFQAKLNVGDMILACNTESFLGISYDDATVVLKQATGNVRLLVISPTEEVRDITVMCRNRLPSRNTARSLMPQLCVFS